MKQLLALSFCCFFILARAQKQHKTLSIIGVGDVMLGTVYPADQLPPADGRHVLAPVAHILRSADLSFGNYEGTLFDGTGLPKKCRDTLHCFAFKTPERYAAYLKSAGFSVMSVANNHSGDFGEEGRHRTLEVLKSAGIAACGSAKQPITIIERNGIKYGIAAFAPNVGTPDINDYPAAAKMIARLDSICDVVIVSFHGGAEGLDRQHVPREKEIFLGENRGDVYAFARMVIDAGADVVFGHGPHVPRAVDLYKGRFIAYSLGNFATCGRFNLKGAAGIAPIVKLYVDGKGKFLKGEIFSIRQKAKGGPVPDKTHAALKQIRVLSAQDFPGSPLLIHSNGHFKRNPKKA